jgi:phosphate transport system substrate-binding protein
MIVLGLLILIPLAQVQKASAAEKYITIKGSDTMVHLVSTWAEAFMNLHKDIEISVTGGGSGTGIAAMINGTTDLCAASRKMKEKEYKLSEEKGIEPMEHIVARDGIAVVVNPENPVSQLSVEQIGKIYTGAYTNWGQVGGPNQPIQVLSRESSSGTYVFFQEHVLKKKDYTTKARLMPATSSIIQTVGEDAWAIGYVGLGYAIEAGDKVKMLAVKETNDAKPIIPSEKTVSSGEYSIARPLQIYSKGEPSGNIKTFLEFCISDEGQKIVRETGYVAVK